MVSIIDENSFNPHQVKYYFLKSRSQGTSASLQATSFELFFFFIILTSEN